MDARTPAASPAEVGGQLNELAAGAGILAMTVFPLALPGLLLFVILPLALVAIPAALLVAPIAVPVWLVRRGRRARDRRRRSGARPADPVLRPRPAP